MLLLLILEMLLLLPVPLLLPLLLLLLLPCECCYDGARLVRAHHVTKLMPCMPTMNVMRKCTCSMKALITLQQLF